MREAFWGVVKAFENIHGVWVERPVELDLVGERARHPVDIGKEGGLGDVGVIEVPHGFFADGVGVQLDLKDDFVGAVEVEEDGLEGLVDLAGDDEGAAVGDEALVHDLRLADDGEGGGVGEEVSFVVSGVADPA